MAYCTQQDLIDRFGEDEIIQLTDRADVGAVDATVVGLALADGFELINGYVGKVYNLPLALTPDLLVKLNADIARFYLYKDDPLETVRDAYKDAVKTLTDIAGGRVVLDVGGVEPSSNVSTVMISGPDRIFTRKTMEGF